MHFEFIETQGSVTNVERLETGEAELGLALADVAYMAFNGRISELPKAAQHMRGIAVLHPSAVHVLVAGDSPIRSLSGSPRASRRSRSGRERDAVTSAILLRAFGVRAEEVRQRSLPFLSAIDELSRRNLDAVFITAAESRGRRSAGDSGRRTASSDQRAAPPRTTCRLSLSASSHHCCQYIRGAVQARPNRAGRCPPIVPR